MTNSLYAYIVAGCMVAACTSSAHQAARESATPAPAPSASQAQAQQMPKGTNVNPDAGLIAEFRKKVDAYVKIRNDAANAAPDLKRTEKPAEINTAEKSMSQIIRAARATAKRGDIFTPATQAMFRRMLREPLNKGGGEGADNKAIIKDDAPAAERNAVQGQRGLSKGSTALDGASRRAPDAAAAA